MRRWPVVAALSYIAAVTIGLFVAPVPPGVGASGAALVAYYTHHAGGTRAAAWLGTVSLIPLALVIAHLRRFTTGISRDLVMLGAIGIFAGTSVWLWFGAGLALHPTDLQPATARTLADIAAFFGPVLTAAVILVVAPVGLAAWNHLDGLPTWLAWGTAAFTLEQAVETTTVLSTHGFTAPGGTMNLGLGAGLFLAWILAATIATMSVPVDRDPAATAT